MAKKKSALKSFLSGNAGAEFMFKNLQFVFFLCLIGMIYIANAHYAEKKVRRIQTMQKEVKEMRWKYMSVQADIMYNYKLSEVMRKVADDGLQLHKPKKIIVED